MKLTYIKATEFCESVRDGTHDTPKQTESGYKLVTGKHVKNGIIDPTEAYYISEKDYNKINERSLVEQWDVLMSMIGTVGEVAVVKNNPNYAIKNVALFKCGGSELKGKWLSYYLRTPEAIGHMNGNQKGSSQQFLSLKQLRDLPIATTSEDVMRKIIDSLSHYDNLIENYQRQIKLLEEAARRLYKEWFVDFRFPGYEHVKVINGIPEKWKKEAFSRRVDVMSGGTPKTSNPEYYNGNIPFYSPKDSDGAFFAFDTETHISQNGLDNCNSKLYPAGTIIITARGTVGKTTILAKPMAMNQSCYALKSEEISSVYYLFFALNQEIAALKTMANGGVFDTIIVKTFDSINITIPTQAILDQFEYCISPIMEAIQNKMLEIILLREARDRLLPKLMSGEIEL
ncbi:restriction endonuclease subunit S [Sellimonas sp.]|uniref:restriction endonuclease subunit S n=1 Tax=Sellimonas sp. TaxID=2021466 RepID=UPI00257C13D5|nr:restriction endonuclease subunit S [Sellimonas sp.]